MLCHLLQKHLEPFYKQNALKYFHRKYGTVKHCEI